MLPSGKGPENAPKKPPKPEENPGDREREEVIGESRAAREELRAEIGEKPVDISEAFSKFGELWDKFWKSLSGLFSFDGFRKTFAEENREVDIEAAKAELHNSPLALRNVDDQTALMYRIWERKIPNHNRIPSLWICTAGKFDRDSRGQEYPVDINHIQSLGHFQLNGQRGGALQRFLNIHKDSFGSLSATTRRKLLSIAEKGQRGRKKGEPEDDSRFENFLTWEEATEFVHFLEQHPEWEFEFRANLFFKTELVQIENGIKKKFPPERHPTVNTFCNALKRDQRYLAVVLDITNQCGAGGAKKGATRVFLGVFEELGGRRLTPALFLSLTMKHGDEAVSKEWEDRRRARTFQVFVQAAGTETSLNMKKAKKEMAIFLGKPSYEREAWLDSVEASRTV